jgi:hypothetical protein
MASDSEELEALLRPDDAASAANGQPDGASVSVLPSGGHGPSQEQTPLHRQPLDFGWDSCDAPVRNLQQAAKDAEYTEGWLRGWLGFHMLCKSSDRFQKLAQFRKRGETGQACELEDPSTPERDAFFQELALAAGPPGWADDEQVKGEEADLAPQERLLPLLEGAATHLEAIDWDWPHAMPRAAFLSHCVWRLLEDKRLLDMLEAGLMPQHGAIAAKLSTHLVRRCCCLHARHMFSDRCRKRMLVFVHHRDGE